MDGPKDLRFYLEEFSNHELPVPRPTARGARHDLGAIEAYFACLETEWLKLVRHYADKLPLLPTETRLIVLIPARFEERRLDRALTALRNESVGLRAACPEILEIIVLNNWYAGEEPDETAATIEAWATENPGILVRCIDVEWPAKTATMAACRKLLADLALYRTLQRPRSTGAVYLVSEDADVEWIEPDRTDAMFRLFEQNPRIDAIRGIQQRTPSALAANHLLMLDRLSWFVAEQLLSRRRLWPDLRTQADFYWNRVVTGGWNTAFSVSAYAQAGGYTPDVYIFEDMDLGQRMSVARGRWDQKRFIPNVGVVASLPKTAWSSAARAALALGSHNHLYSHGGLDGSFYTVQKSEDPIRCGSLIQALDQIRPYRRYSSTSAPRFHQVLTDLCAEMFRVLRCRELSVALMGELLQLLGLRRDEVRCDASGLLIRSLVSFTRTANLYARTFRHPARPLQPLSGDASVGLGNQETVY